MQKHKGTSPNVRQNRETVVAKQSQNVAAHPELRVGGAEGLATDEQAGID